MKRWKITSGTRGSPVDDAFCIFLWNPSIKELCCVVRRATREVPGACCAPAVRLVPAVCLAQGATYSVELRARRCAISCAVRRSRRCAISYVVTLFEVTRVRCKTLEGVRAKRKRPKPPLCLSWTQPLCLPKPPRACRGFSLCAQCDVCRAMRHTLWHSRSAATCRCEARCKSLCQIRSVL